MHAYQIVIIGAEEGRFFRVAIVDFIESAALWDTRSSRLRLHVSCPRVRDFAKLRTCRSEAEIPSRGAYLPKGGVLRPTNSTTT